MPIWEESDSLINFDLNGAKAADDVSTSTYIEKGGDATAFAANLASHLDYVGHDFKGWYTRVGLCPLILSRSI